MRSTLINDKGSTMLVKNVMNKIYQAVAVDSTLQEVLDRYLITGVSTYPVLNGQEFFGAVSLDGLGPILSSGKEEKDL